METAVLGKRQTVLGFRLSGVKTAMISSENESELLAQFEELAEREEVALLIVDNSCEKIREHMIRFIEEHRRPIIVEIPSRKEKIEQGIVELITKSATGAKSNV